MFALSPSARSAAPPSLIGGAAPLLVLPRGTDVNQSSVAAAGGQVYPFVLLFLPIPLSCPLFPGGLHSALSENRQPCIRHGAEKRRGHLIGGSGGAVPGPLGGPPGCRLASPHPPPPHSSPFPPWAAVGPVLRGLCQLGCWPRSGVAVAPVPVRSWRRRVPWCGSGYTYNVI